jgi:hypothetical protein
MLRKVSFFGCMAAMLATPAFAAAITPPPKNQPLVTPGNLYAVEVRCQPVKALEDASSFVVGRNRSLFLLITKSVPTKSPDGTSALPADTVAAMQLYSIGKDQATKQPVIFDARDCKKDFLLNGSKELVLVPTENRSDNFSDSSFGQVVSSALSLVSPVFSLITGAALPVAVAGTLTNIGAVQTAIPNLLNALSRGKNYTIAIQNLREGTYKIGTEYVTITIVIRPVDSIVFDKNPQYREDLKKQVDGATTTKLDPDEKKIEQTCRGALYDVSQLGFRSPTDLAYGVLHLSAHAGFNQDQSMPYRGLCLSCRQRR